MKWLLYGNVEPKYPQDIFDPIFYAAQVGNPYRPNLYLEKLVYFIELLKLIHRLKFTYGVRNLTSNQLKCHLGFLENSRMHAFPEYNRSMKILYSESITILSLAFGRFECLVSPWKILHVNIICIAFEWMERTKEIESCKEMIKWN